MCDTHTAGAMRPGRNTRLRAFSMAGAMLALAAAVPALAQSGREAPPYNTVDLQAEAQREVDNDTLNALLFVELSETDPAKLADALNRVAADALALAKSYKQVRTRTGNVQTYPVYDKTQRLTGWRGRTELRVESRDFPAAAALIGRLQSTMQLGQIGFSVSPERRKAAEDEIIGAAISAFQARADIVRSSLGGRAYKIRRLAVNAGGGFVPPRPLMARGAASPAAPAVAPPPLEGGVSQVAVSVNGTIEVE